MPSLKQDVKPNPASYVDAKFAWLSFEEHKRSHVPAKLHPSVNI